MISKTNKVAEYMFKTGLEMFQTHESPDGIEPLTVGEKLSKNIDIRIELKNLHNPKDSTNLEKCQLVVYLNNKVKYVSKKGALEPFTYEIWEGDWKVWHFVNHRKVMYGAIRFKNDKHRQHFRKFCALCRACNRIDNEFDKLRDNYKIKITV